jgi:hypothetical protein
VSPIQGCQGHLLAINSVRMETEIKLHNPDREKGGI